MINPEKLNFKHLIMTIGNLPSSYVESLSYYEGLLWLCNYLEKTVIPAVNNNAEALEELQTLYVQLKNYVDNYFENLDVQEEINNKLDDLVEDGTLETLLNNYNLYYKNVTLIGKFYQKLISKSNLVINCQGDSLTYGQDNNSADKRSPDSNPADDGANHTNYRASVTYPEELQTIFDTMFGSNVVTVNNLGFSGDTAKTSYTRWTVDREADLVLLMLGTNDSKQSSWVPLDYRNNISEYFDYMGKIIERYLEWNTAVILLTPPSGKTQNSDNVDGKITTNVYDSTLKLFAKKYNCPIVEVENYIDNNFDDRFYSDAIHLNGTGYKAFADKLFAIFCGTGLINGNFEITSQTQINASNYNSVLNGINSSPFVTSSANNQDGNNKIMTISNNGKICYGFNIKYDNALVIPICTNHGDLIVDFNSEQPLSTIKYTNSGVTYKNAITNMSLDTARNPARVREDIIKAIASNDYLLIPSKGYHTIMIQSNNAGSVYVNGFIIMPLEEASKYINKLVFSLRDTSLVDNKYKIPLNVLNLLFWTNTTIEREDGGRYSICPNLDVTINSGGGMVCYKLPLAIVNRELPLNNDEVNNVNGILSNELLKYYDVDYADNTHGIKSTLASMKVDNTDLVITFDNYNEYNTGISIS